MEPILPESGGGRKKKPGRRAHAPTDADRVKVGNMARLGIPHYQIAMVFEIAVKTLQKHYKEELSKAAVEANVTITETLYNMAVSGKDAAATIFWAKTRCGFRSNMPALSDTGAAPPAAGASALVPAPAAVPPGRVIITNSQGEPVA